MLIPASIDQVRAIIDGDSARASVLLGAVVPPGWPAEAEAREGLPWHLTAMEADPGQRLWRIRFVIQRSSNSLIGSVNLKGPPLEAGEVEIGWGIVPEARGQGFATEASRAVIEWAVRASRVRRVSATIPETNTASQNVARRLGMARTDETRRGLPVWAMSR